MIPTAVRGGTEPGLSITSGTSGRGAARAVPLHPPLRARQLLGEIAQHAVHARAASRIVVAPLLRGDLVRVDAAEAMALEESRDGLARRACERAGVAAFARPLAKRRDDVPADPLPEEARQRVERGDLARARFRVGHQRADAGEVAALDER